jgi:hypothetical protein
MISALVIASMVTIALLGYELTYGFYQDAEEKSEIDKRLRQVTK